MSSRQDEIAVGFEAANMERAAQWRLEASAYTALKAVKCRFHEGTLVLDGRVPTYFHKQLAQEAIRALPGIREIINQISVRREMPQRHGAWKHA
jgi:osmotically-inducible protein OsmY